MGLAPRREVQPVADRFGIVAAITAWVGTALLLVALGRVVQLQLRPGEQLKSQLVSRATTRTELPARGEVVDRRGRLVASTTFARRVVVDPTIFAVGEHAEEDIARLARAAGVDAEQMRDKLAAAREQNMRRAEAAKSWTPASEELVTVAPRIDADSHRPFDPFAAAQAQALGASEHQTAPKAESGPALPKGPPGPIRYLVLSDLLSEERELAVRSLMRSGKGLRPIRGVTLERQQAREFVGGDAMASLVGKVGFGHKGLMGVELRQEEQLSGTEGSLTYIRDRSGRPLWIEPTGVEPAQAGQTVRLSIDSELQRIVHEELTRQVEETNAQGGRCVLVDPATGEVLAMVDVVREVPEAIPYPWVPVMPASKKGEPARPAVPEPVLDSRARYRVFRPDPGRAIHPALGRNRCVEDVYEPGSTFKPFIWSVITELGRAKPDEVLNTEGGRWVTPDRRYLEDVTKRDFMRWTDVLVNSSNIGMVKGGTRLSAKEMHDACVRFGFGQRTNIGLPGEAQGIVTSLANWKPGTHTSVCFGNEVAVTPLQMARAFSAFARHGHQSGTLPTLRLRAADSDEGAPVTFRVLPPEVATLTRETMRGVIDVVDRNAAKKDMPPGGWRYTLFGKSGTSKIPLGGAPDGMRAPRGSKGYFENQFISSFIAGGPVEAPALVCIVVIDDPGPRPGVDRRMRYGSSAAGPAVRRIMERALTYLGVPASPDAEITRIGQL